MLDITGFEGYAPIFKYFEEISLVPRGSENTSGIAEYLVNFAKARGLEYIRDAEDNVIIKKPATRGYEDRPTVIIQGHSDIVAEKTADSAKDMTREGLDIYRDGDLIKARETTLGADDGVALAYALALLDGAAEAHPNLEVLITSNEEIGLLGATELDGRALCGRTLINIDSEEEGVFTAGCAGGVRCDISLPVKYEKTDAKKAYRVRLHGLLGGHSGIEIDKGRSNAIKVMGELFNMLYPFDWEIAEMSGGNADNAIPLECCAVITGGDDLPERLRYAFSRRQATFAVIPNLPINELRKLDETGLTLLDIEPNAALDIEEVPLPEKALDRESTATLTSLLILLPSGVIAMSRAIPDLVETSLNLGILRLGECAVASLSVRSAIGKEKARLCERLADTAKRLGAKYGERGAYPAWEYKEKSHLRDVMVGVYEKRYGKAPKVVIIHAGLECGILAEKLEGLDCISIGPDIFDVHTTEERLSVPSFVRVWDYLKEVLKSI
ncbi:MAG: beta-Ala-His dipeptidase [Clostridia bacterium]|nr:beta-Ala-His dipeptidase [Clostridia bacterium]